MCNRFRRHRRIISCWYAAVCSGGAVTDAVFCCLICSCWQCIRYTFLFFIVEFIEVLKTVLHLRFNCTLSGNAIHIFQNFANVLWGKVLQQQHQGTSTFASEYEPSLFAQQTNRSLSENRNIGCVNGAPVRFSSHHDWLWKLKCSPEEKSHKKL